uniref:Gentisate 1,2 dioxygenase 1 n=1 Tax=Aquipseudomonas alcaligenes TaxID=43263 RepID=GDO1_AQUAC|nr:RecName: Full=Gentisate 1,2 dioxygenase 1; Short=GDOI [Pseudomonas alcaligenes]AAD49427.1 gentisate 1,2-dioxygenase [Pseudomonas alcaligenes]
MSFTEKPAVTKERKEFYSKLESHDLAPLWEVLNEVVTTKPKSNCAPHLWEFEVAKEFLMEAGTLITAKEAERRVLILENPGLKGLSRITTSLYAGLQLILPGEVAPTHRHSQSALRFVVDGGGACTSVDGERTTMQVGDFVITPPWAWHDHVNDSDKPMIWMDGLDLPMVTLFDTSFAEGYGEDIQEITRPNGDSLARYGANMLPVDFKQKGLSSPIFNYPYERSREALEAMKKANEWDPCHGLKMQYINPLDGMAAMPTISSFIQLLPKEFRTQTYRSTDATVFSVIEGQGKTRIGDKVFFWKAKDTFVVPSWYPVEHEASSDAVLFSYSDRVAQQKLGFWRESRN